MGASSHSVHVLVAVVLYMELWGPSGAAERGSSPSVLASIGVRMPLPSQIAASTCSLVCDIRHVRDNLLSDIHTDARDAGQNMKIVATQWPQTLAGSMFACNRVNVSVKEGLYVATIRLACTRPNGRRVNPTEGSTWPSTRHVRL